MAKTDNYPLVSIIMATYNEPALLIKKSIHSILNQDYSNIELLIADDSTNIETIEVINSIANENNRVKIIRKGNKMGFVPALNYALREAKGSLIARMDGDDVALPDRITKQVNYALNNPTIDVFGGSINIIDENDKIISERYYPTSSLSIQIMFVFRSPFAHPTIMFRRKIIDTGFFYNPFYKKAEDIDFFIRLYKHGYKFGNLKDKLLNYRVPNDLQEKRNREQWIFNHKARKKFILRRPFFSIASFVISWTYKHIPNAFVARYYRKENNKIS